jgi:hypothetical protein
LIIAPKYGLLDFRDDRRETLEFTGGPVGGGGTSRTKVLKVTYRVWAGHTNLDDRTATRTHTAGNVESRVKGQASTE